MNRYLPPPAATNPIPADPPDEGWVTLYTIFVPGIGWTHVQKRDGSTRSVRATGRQPDFSLRET